MNVSDAIHGRVATIDLRPADDERIPEGLISKSEVFLYHDDGGAWRLEVAGDVREVEGAAPPERDTLRRIGIHGLPRLVWLAQATPPTGGTTGRDGLGRILIQVHEFPSALVWEEPMEIGVDDRLVEDLRKRLRRSISVESAVQWLADRMLLPPRHPAGRHEPFSPAHLRLIPAGRPRSGFMAPDSRWTYSTGRTSVFGRPGSSRNDGGSKATNAGRFTS